MFLLSRFCFYIVQADMVLLRVMSFLKINSRVYSLANNEYEDERKSDVVYTADDQEHSERTPPLLVEVQQKVDLAFKRLTPCCLNIHDRYKVKAVVAVFITQGSASNAF